MHYSFRRPEFGPQCSHWAAPGYPTSSYVLKGHISQNKNKGIIETQRIVWLFPSNFYVYLKKKSQQTITDDYYPARASCFFVTNPKYFRDIIYSIQMALV